MLDWVSMRTSKETRQCDIVMYSSNECRFVVEQICVRRDRRQICKPFVVSKVVVVVVEFQKMRI